MAAFPGQKPQITTVQALGSYARTLLQQIPTIQLTLLLGGFNMLPDSDPALASAPDQTLRIPAVQRCCEAVKHSLCESKSRRRESYETRKLAAQAYRKAMPDLCGYDNIRDFIACTSYGMLLGIIDTSEGSKFLYAAQVAVGALHREPKAQLRAGQSAPCDCHCRTASMAQSETGPLPPPTGSQNIA